MRMWLGRRIIVAAFQSSMNQSSPDLCCLNEIIYKISNYLTTQIGSGQK